ncbi:4-hydroxy-3-polyprenylbenzoate decarboxylase [Actinacidiphila paucisporea]|uniref:Flavin prenyltransferase UbiX n=1 Tax=Actinacidiphila paucisporea TaxID=310782 RepID=A0A1M7PVP4_9ACTN|nr:4-hydroxy-3-polyprenylbenzoate decarboxylase [Actinacidiphila paucisporea]
MDDFPDFPDDGTPDGLAGRAPRDRTRAPWVVGVSGASGTPYAAAVLRALLHAGEDVDLVVSRAARLTLLDETGAGFRDAHWREDLAALLARGADGTPDRYPPADLSRVRHWPAGDLAAGPSSGSYPAKGMLIVPASTACVAGVALGLSKDLLQRAASVTLKERRPLVVAVRETPLGGQTLRHLVAIDDAGAIVLPASPAFYTGAVHIQDLVDFVAGRVLDAAGVPHTLYRRWRGELGGAAHEAGAAAGTGAAEPGRPHAQGTDPFMP